MKEFIEKLIGRLEELKTFKLNLADSMSELMKKDRLDNYISKEEVVEIVNELAEEYKPNVNPDIQEVIDKLEVYTAGRLNTSKVEISVLQLQRYINRLKQISEEYNNGWISVDDRLPSDEKEFLVTLKSGEVTSAKYDTYEKVFVDIVEEYYEYPVIAWQPLPKPYQTKGE